MLLYEDIFPEMKSYLAKTYLSLAKWGKVAGYLFCYVFFMSFLLWFVGFIIRFYFFFTSYLAYFYPTYIKYQFFQNRKYRVKNLVVN